MSHFVARWSGSKKKKKSTRTTGYST